MNDLMILNFSLLKKFTPYILIMLFPPPVPARFLLPPYILNFVFSLSLKQSNK